MLEGRILVPRDTAGSGLGSGFEVGLELDGRIMVHRDTERFGVRF